LHCLYFTRLADRIAYLPTDLEDGLTLNIITREQLPAIVTKTLGTSAREMIDVLVKDVISCSRGRNYVTMSEKCRLALDALFDFNYAHIYHGEFKTGWNQTIEICINSLFEHFTQTQGMTAQDAIDTIASLTDAEALAKTR